MHTTPPDWLPDDLATPQVLAIRGWQGRLFALVEHADGAALCFHDGEVRRAESAADLLATCSEDVRTVLGLSVESAELAALLDRTAARAEAGHTEEAWAIVAELEALFGGPVRPELAQRPTDRDAFLRAALHRAAAFFRAGDEAAGRRQVLELAASAGTEAEPWSAFFWWRDAEEVRAAVDAARTLPPATEQALPAAVDGWQRLELAEPVPHPAGLEVDAVPVIPGTPVAKDSAWRQKYSLLARGSARLARLVELAAPAAMIDKERAMQARFLAELVALGSGPEPSSPARHVPREARRPLPLQAPPPEPGELRLFRVPYHYPGLYVVQLREGLLVLGPEGERHRLPPCSWRPLFGSKRYVAFAGPVRSGPAPAGIAVLDVEAGAWLERWPDEPGVANLHEAWLPEEDGHGATWLVDPRQPASRPLPGAVLACESEYGRRQLVRMGAGLALCAPTPEGLALAAVDMGDGPPSWRVDVRTGAIAAEPWDPWGEGVERPAELDRPWSPAEAELAGLSRAAHGALIVLWRGAVYVDGERVILLDGPVDAVSIEGGNGSRNGHLAVLANGAVLELRFDAHGEDEPGSMALVHRLVLPT